MKLSLRWVLLIACEIAVSECKELSLGKVFVLSSMKLLITVISGGKCPACKVMPYKLRMVSLSLRDAIASGMENSVVLPMLILAICAVAAERSESGPRSVIL